MLQSPVAGLRNAFQGARAGRFSRHHSFSGDSYRIDVRE
jgi:hypothetical protein